ncbi:MAG: pyridoxal phosphate-dependent aminotransferase [Planctomycetota bacterium]|jgi:aspartate aminotransferase|nr:pyridoxal phosphate-dependent aminotransferase [Planctomycetota bacterium]
MAEGYLSRRVRELAPSATQAMNMRAKKLEAEGKNVISFSVGEPDFKTPKHICDAAKKAIDDGWHAYTPNGGVPELKQAIARALSRDTGVEYAPDQVVASTGAKFSIYLALLALLDEGDEAIIPAPYWVSYPEMVQLCGGKPVVVASREEDAFALSPDALAAAVGDRTKVLILNSPSNPTGQIYQPEVIEAIGRVMERRGLWCISDEIYNHLIFGGGKHKSITTVSDYCREHTVIVNGCSKTYAMTGWRMGWIGAPKAMAKAIDDLQSQTTSNPTSITQAAATAALDGPQDCVREMVAEFEKRRVIIHGLLNDIDGLSCSMPSGAFYVLPNVSDLLGRTIAGVKVATPNDLCGLLLDKARIACVPGGPFGAPEHIRMSYATSAANIEEGCRRFKNLIEKGDGA